MYNVENYPQIKDNFYLSGRNIGASRKLKGNVGIIVCLLKRKPTDFSKSTETQFFTALYEACEWLKTEAKRYGTDLNFKNYYYTIDVPKNANPKDGYDLIREFFNSKTINMDSLQNHYEGLLNLDETPFLLVFDEVSRSFAFKQSTHYYGTNESSVVFKDMRNSFQWSTIAHELLHQFGAIDYYYPPEVTECAKLYIKDSIMGIGKNNVLDDLSAYLVGIKDTVSANSYHFLKNTMWMNKELYERAVDTTWKTDYGKNNKQHKSSDSSVQTTNDNQIKFKPIYSQTAGTVLRVNVSAGQIVNAGDAILLTAGSDADVAVCTSVSGRVDRIYAKSGDTVKTGSLVAVIARV